MNRICSIKKYLLTLTLFMATFLLGAEAFGESYALNNIYTNNILVCPSGCLFLYGYKKYGIYNYQSTVNFQASFYGQDPHLDRMSIYYTSKGGNFPVTQVTCIPQGTSGTCYGAPPLNVTAGDRITVNYHAVGYVDQYYTEYVDICEFTGLSSTCFQDSNCCSGYCNPSTSQCDFH
jgi:hypothetical protein